MPNILARRCSSVRCMVAGVELSAAVLSYSLRSPPSTGQWWLGASFNHFYVHLYVDAYIHLSICFVIFFLYISIYMFITFKLNC